MHSVGLLKCVKPTSDAILIGTHRTQENESHRFELKRLGEGESCAFWVVNEQKENRSGNRKAINWIGKILFSILNFFFRCFCLSKCLCTQHCLFSFLLHYSVLFIWVPRFCLLLANRYWMRWSLHPLPHIVFQRVHIDNAASVATIQIYAASRAHAIRACIGFCFQYLPSAAVGGVSSWRLVADGARAWLVWYRISVLSTRFRCDAEAATLEIVE